MSSLSGDSPIGLMIKKALSEWPEVGGSDPRYYFSPNRNDPEFIVTWRGHEFVLVHVQMDFGSQLFSVGFVCSVCGFVDNSNIYSDIPFQTLQKNPCSCEENAVRSILEE